MNLLDTEVKMSLKEYIEMHDALQAFDNNKVECTLKQTYIRINPSYGNGGGSSSVWGNSTTGEIETPVYKAKEEIIAEIQDGD